ncbi:MAG: 30S ribosome-binding factor RbfA [Pseudomonadota bacterium]
MKSAKAPSQRQLRVGELVRHAVSDVLARETLDDPVLRDASISVTEVRMSPDLKIATCFISPLGGGLVTGKKAKPAPNAKALCAALEKKAGFIRARATPHLSQMKFLPKLRFREDTSFDNFSRIDALLRSEAVQRDTHSRFDGADGEKDE